MASGSDGIRVEVLTNENGVCGLLSNPFQPFQP